MRGPEDKVSGTGGGPLICPGSDGEAGSRWNGRGELLVKERGGGHSDETIWFCVKDKL